MQKYKLLKKLHLRWCFVTTYAVEHNPVLFYSLDFHNIAQVWKNIKEVSKPVVSKSQTLFNKVFWNIN